MEGSSNKNLLSLLKTSIKSLCRQRRCQEDCPRRTSISFRIGIELVDIYDILSFVQTIKIYLSHVDVVGLSIFTVFLRYNLSSFAVEKVLNDFVSDLDGVFGIRGKKVEKLGVDIEAQFSIFTCFSINFFGLFFPILPVLEVSQSIAHSEIFLVFNRTDEIFLQLSKKFKVIKNLRIC